MGLPVLSLRPDLRARIHGCLLGGGVVMRAAPAGLLARRHCADVFELGRDIAALTRGHVSPARSPSPQPVAQPGEGWVG